MADKTKVFQEVAPAKVPRSAFDLSYNKKFTADFAKIYPIVHDMAIPGDIWNIGQSAVIRMQPMVAPILHEIDVKSYYFFIPLRIIDDTFESFITKGVSGNTVVTPDLFDPSLFTTPSNVVAENTLWDFFGFPTGIIPAPEFCPTDWLRKAYIRVYNEYFRDENLQAVVDETAGVNYELLTAAWQKDYFTSATTATQRGTPVSLAVFGSASADFSIPGDDTTGSAPGDRVIPLLYYPDNPNFPGIGFQDGTGTALGPGTGLTQSIAGWNKMLDDYNTVDGSSFTSVDISDLRLAFAIQVWQERNMRAGVRLNEFLQAHYQVSPRDERLQRPEFIGGSKHPIIISEVLQTSATSGEPTPQGNLAGHGLAVSGTHIGNYRVEEHGIILGLMVIRPKPAYQNGINRQWLTRTPFDFYFPEFAQLSEQEIYNGELITKDIVADPTGVYNNGIFGYTGRYNEHRYKPDMVCGEMRTTFDYWHLGRQFNPASPPALNEAFIKCDPRTDIFAVPSVPGFIINWQNHISALRPMPFMAEPSMLGG